MCVRVVWRLLLLMLIFAAAAAQKKPGLPLDVPIGIDSPSAPGSAEPNLYGAPDGRVFLSWIEPGQNKGHALRFSELREFSFTNNLSLPQPAWSEPRTIAEGENWFVNWADFPSLIALPAGRLAAHWLVKSGAGAYAYDVNLSQSIDGGSTWSKPIVPHRDGTQTEHGFVSLLSLQDGGVGAAWLDGRNFKGSEHQGHGASKSEMTLCYARIDKEGRLSDEAVLDNRVCECCQTSAAITLRGVVVAYRDRSAAEVRDISVVRRIGSRWTEPRTVHQDGWRIEGCPVNGPSVAADGNRVVVGWFTGANDSPMVKVAFSSDAGDSFGAPIRVDDGSPIGRVQTLVLPDGTAVVVWLERTGKEGEIRIRRVGPNETRGKSITVSKAGLARASGFPRMAHSGEKVIVAWTDSSKPSRVHTAVIRLQPIR